MDPENISNPIETQCPTCGNLISSEIEICLICGNPTGFTKLSIPDKSPMTIQTGAKHDDISSNLTQRETNRYTCRNCGKLANLNESYCSECGFMIRSQYDVELVTTRHEVESNQVDQDQSPDGEILKTIKSDRDVKFLTIIIFLLLLVCGFILLVILFVQYWIPSSPSQITIKPSVIDHGLVKYNTSTIISTMPVVYNGTSTMPLVVTTLLINIPESTSTLPRSTIGANISLMDGMVMVRIPAGEFIRGSGAFELARMLELCPVCDPTSVQDQLPQVTIYLDEFWIDRTEVTNAQFATFVAETGFITTAENRGKSNVMLRGGSKFQYIEGADWRHPIGPNSTIIENGQAAVTQISWDDAKAYCEWAGRRLPTEAEWEKAARGTDGWMFPWGNEMPGASLLNFNYENDGPVQVGSFPGGGSPYGVLDMSGNVWEWVSDYYNQDYYAQAPEYNPSGPSDGKGHVFRGGSWASELVREMVNVTTTYRLWNYPYISSNVLGIRCASSAPRNDLVTITPLSPYPWLQTPAIKLTNTLQQRSTITPPVSSSLDGEWIAFAYGENRNRLDLFMRNLLTGDQRQLTSNTTLEESPDFSPDGRYLVYTSCRPDCDLYRMDLQFYSEEKISNYSFRAKFPDYCRDLTKPWIVFEGRLETDQSVILMIDLMTNKLTQLTNGKADLSPSFSPDCSQVAILRADQDTNGNGQIDTNDRSDIYILDIATRKARPIVRTPGEDEIGLTWFPDGQSVAFGRISRDTNGDGILTLDDQSDLYTLNLDGGEERNISLGRFSVFSPAWSPDGMQIVFSNFLNEGQQELWIYSLAKAEFTQFTETGPYYHPAWSP